MPVPSLFTWFSAAAAIACFMVVRRSKRRAVRILCVNTGILLLMFCAVETAFGYLLSRRNSTLAQYPGDYFQPDDVLGGAARHGASRVREIHGGTVVYDVTYTIGVNGLRVAPPDSGAAARQCAIFFGDSFMFGEGLADTLTLPYRAGVIAGGGVRVYNFGFHGFGAQQMLAALEQKRVDSAVECRPSHIIYEGIPDHVARAAGLYKFMTHGPRYEILPGSGGADSVAYRGHFDDGHEPGVLGRVLSTSWIYRWLASLNPPPDDADLRRYVAIVVAAQRLSAAKYPGSTFDVLWWPIHGMGPLGDQVLPALRQAGLHVHSADDILPGFPQSPSAYWLSAYDAHPNARADDLLAHYVARVIFK